MLRSPVTANSYLLYHATSIPKILNKSDQEYLHRGYFALPKHLELFDQQIQSTGSLQDLHHELCNIIVNDWQHWHLGNTMHWTPLRDLDIFKIIVRLPLEDCIHQIMDSSFSRILMERNIPGVSKSLSDQKNVGPVFKNLSSLFNRS
jgi:hypothetical protein